MRVLVNIKHKNGAMEFHTALNYCICGLEFFSIMDYYSFRHEKHGTPLHFRWSEIKELLIKPLTPSQSDEATESCASTGTQDPSKS